MRTPHPRRVARRGLAATAVACMALTGLATVAQATTTDPNPGPLETANAALAQRAATEGMVLLENRDHALPMAASGNVAVFGVGAYKTVKGGTGSGSVNNRDTITVRQGLEDAGYRITTSDDYWSAMTSAYDKKYGNSGNQLFGPGIDYASVEQPLTAQSAQPTSDTDTAIYVIARNSGEGADRSAGKGDFELGDTERANIERLGQTYRHVVVVLNTGGVMDTSFFKQVNAAETDPDGGTALDSLLLMSQAGEQSGAALVQVLDGEVTPSGKLTDTWAAAYSDYPASAAFAKNDGSSSPEKYSEGLYVGYRYFDSFYKKLGNGDPAGVVNYPFGYGLSYTDFSVEPLKVTANAKKVTVRARVTNSGDTYAGKEVVETYVSAPQSGLDKPYQQLAGYAKTDSLAPGRSQVVTIRFDTASLASFDTARSEYVLNKGDYVVRVGDSSRNTSVAAKLSLGRDAITEKVNHEASTAESPGNELTSSSAYFYTYPGEARQIDRAPTVILPPAAFRTADSRSRHEQSVPVDDSAPYEASGRATIARTTAYLPQGQTDWDGTGAPYSPKPGESVEQVGTDAAATLYDVAAGRITMQQFVAGLSLTQLADIVEGANQPGSTLTAVGAAGYTTAAYEKLGIPGMALSDGPAGLRLTPKISGDPTTYQWATAWPIGTMLAQTWNRSLVQEVGDAVGKEMAEYGVTMWLAPGMNLHRDPLNGRNFEYYSEDPLVTGLTAAATTRGVQSNPGIGVTIKHFALNNQETQRNGGDSVASERTMRELYLKGFEIAVKSAQPMAVMSSYNKINGTYAAQDYDTLTDILRGEWGFKGLVMSDWGGSIDPVATMYAGNDLIEPGGAPADIIKNSRKMPPTLDVTGLPVYAKTTYSAFNYTRYNWQFNGITPSADGAETFATTVDKSTDLSHPASTNVTYDEIFNRTVTPVSGYASVDDAYQAVQQLLAGSALSAAEKAGINITDVVHQDASDSTSPVVSYKLTITGDYASSFPMRLGDVQRSASRILTVAMHSTPFQELAHNQGVGGVSVGSWSGQFPLANPMSDATGPVTKASSSDGGLHVGRPAIHGTPRPGHTLRATAPDHTTGAALHYQWLRDGAAIREATGQRYEVTGSDRGHRISVEVRATKAHRQAVTKVSRPVTVR